ncbi:UdgX family uracil-DNA binding protein [Phenylobacterium deserti]|uniref:Type-4 uracil-DNA glycosylase n=1 Tax=Phenylobacterium deserti TaxID=1914756 RepID=A0A328AWC3_9CAUL|nr:UdgX family uracil-DNA binding protein [Phenylobacterium deserti]RAK58016.1 uracil-DNA glycosylase [Phenylobacterium deserti]
MEVVRLEHVTDFAGWRTAARSLRARSVPPEAVIWTVEGQGRDLFSDGGGPPAPAAQSANFTVPRDFMELAEDVALHRSEDRWALLYRMLWRITTGEPNLARIASDPNTARARSYARQVSQAAHKMKAFVRFREIPSDTGVEAYVAWFEPAHRVAERTAPFFARRFANMRFSILTPDVCVLWDTQQLAFAPGATPDQAPSFDELEDFWRTYYASIFNPARLNPSMMQKEMPKRYWRNLPEARLIPELIARAEARTEEMVAQAPSEPNRRALRRHEPEPSGIVDGHHPSTLEEIRAGVQACRRCDLWRDATQGVPGEGPGQARLMFVGEQPGDQEDLAGQPFVGPAGQVLNKALDEAGVPRAETYVTNAVKHFKHEMRGKRRLHKTPDTGEVTACRWWIDHERQIVRPRVVVALGATAALSVFGKPTAIAKFRQQAIQLPDQSQGVVTYHPSYLLRVPDAAAKAKAYAMFVEDLKYAWALAA